MRSHCWDMFGLPLPTLYDTSLITCCILEGLKAAFEYGELPVALFNICWQTADLFLRALH